MIFLVALSALSTFTQDFLRALGALLTSKKVITAVSTCVAAYAAKRGLDLPDGLVAAIMGIGAVLVHAQGQTDLGKEAARINIAGSVRQVVESAMSASGEVSTKKETTTTIPVSGSPAVIVSSDQPKGSVAPRLMLVLAFACVGISFSACKGAKAVGQTALDCTKPSAKAAIAEYGLATTTAVVSAGVQGNGSLVTDAIETILKGFVSDEAKCVGLTSVAKLLTPSAPVAGAAQSSPLVANPDEVKAELERLKAQIAPGREVKLEGGY